MPRRQLFFQLSSIHIQWLLMHFDTFWYIYCIVTTVKCTHFFPADMQHSRLFFAAPESMHISNLIWRKKGDVHHFCAKEAPKKYSWLSHFHLLLLLVFLLEEETLFFISPFIRPNGYLCVHASLIFRLNYPKRPLLRLPKPQAPLLLLKKCIEKSMIQRI